MMKKSILTAAAVVIAGGAFAASLSPQQALQRASSTAEGKRLAKNGVQPVLAYTVSDRIGDPSLYVFNQGNEGFMLLSADSEAIPVLGYTDGTAFDATNIPPQMKYWMDEYSRQIEFARSKGVKGVQKVNAPAEWTYVAPLVKTTWDQGVPYNNSCPTIGLDHYPTGCVATAMAQIMNYWKYPQIGRGEVSYTWNPSRTLTMSFDRQDFDWANMLDAYYPGQYNSAQANAVAYLMKACGYGAWMQYAAGASGTSSMMAGVAMVTYFNYDNGIKTADRMTFTDSDWTALVYNQVKNVGPALYSGSSDEGGHAFVVDGYDGNGYFHINWGWSGMCNGFYLLTALNPSQQGTGGYMGGYNFDQSLLYDIQKPKSEPNNPAFSGQLSLRGSLKAANSGPTLSFTLGDWKDAAYINTSFAVVSAYFGIEITKADGSGNPVYVRSSTTRSYPIGSFYRSGINITAKFDESLPDGKYKVTLVWQKGNEWMHFLYPVGYYDYVYVTKSGSSYTVENLSPQSFNVTAAEIVSPLYYGYPCQIDVTFSNPYPFEITQLVIPRLLVDGKVNYEGDNNLVSVAPGGSSKLSLIYNFNLASGGKVPSSARPADFTLNFYDPNTGTDYGTFGNVSMRRTSGTPTVTATDFSILNATEETIEPIGKIYVIKDPSAVDLSLTLSVGGNNAFLASPITLSLSEVNENGQIGYSIFDKDFENYAFIASGESGTMTTVMNLTGYYNPSNLYAITPYYLDGGHTKALNPIYLTSTSGVGAIVSEGGDLSLGFYGGVIDAASAAGISEIAVYDIQGSKVANTRGSRLDINGIANGVYIVRAIDNSGNSKVIKIVK